MTSDGLHTEPAAGGHGTLVVQSPAPVQPAWATVFYETPDGAAYRHDRAAGELARLRRAAVDAGLDAVELTSALYPDAAVAARRDRARAELEELALGSVDGAGRAVAGVIPDLSDGELVELVLSRPQLELRADDELRRLSPDAATESYRCRPPFGLVFPRDHYVLGRHGCVLGRFRRPDRRPETAIAHLALRNLGCVVRELPPGLHLEGGDVLEGGSVSVAAHGFRTDEESVRFLLRSGAFRTDTVLVLPDAVRDPFAFHLDMYATVLGGALFVDSRHAKAMSSGCAVHRFDGTAYVPAAEGLSLAEACRTAGIRLHVCDGDDGRGFAYNVLPLPGHRTLLVPEKHVLPQIVTAAEEAGLAVRTIPFHEAHRMYGSLHCATNTLPATDRIGTPS